MNDDPDHTLFERELRALRPAAPSSHLEERITGLLAVSAPLIPQSAWWRRLGFARLGAALGWGLMSPAAAVVVTLAVVHFNARTKLPSPPVSHADLAAGSVPRADRVVATRATPNARAVNVLSGAFDEGVVPDGGDGLARRVRYRSTDLVQWRNPRTGAQWEVSYPREDVLLVPVNAE